MMRYDWIYDVYIIYMCVCACTLGIQSLVQLRYHCDNIPHHHVPVMQGHQCLNLAWLWEKTQPVRVSKKSEKGGIHGLNRCGVNLAGFPCQNSKMILYIILENPAFIDDLIIFNHWIVQVKAANKANLTPPPKKKNAPRTAALLGSTWLELDWVTVAWKRRLDVCVCLINVNVNIC